jgi:hypothetical protein
VITRDTGAGGRPEPLQNPLADHCDAATLPEAVPENEEVVPVNVSTWVLPSGVTVGR